MKYKQANGEILHKNFSVPQAKEKPWCFVVRDGSMWLAERDEDGFAVAFSRDNEKALDISSGVRLRSYVLLRAHTLTIE